MLIVVFSPTTLRTRKEKSGLASRKASKAFISLPLTNHTSLVYAMIPRTLIEATKHFISAKAQRNFQWKEPMCLRVPLCTLISS